MIIEGINMKKFLIALSLCLTAGSSFAAQNVNELLKEYQAEAKKADAKFTGFDAKRGEQFYHAKHEKNGKEVSCATCHMDDPKKVGKNPKTNKEIHPMAPVAYDKRFADPAKTEKAFHRNCNDMLGRSCTAQEKGDFITYLNSVK